MPDRARQVQCDVTPVRGGPAPPVALATMRLVIARCSVDYVGRLTAHLPSAPRLILVKADGTVSIHADDRAYKPLNWMSPPCTLKEEADGAGIWTVINKAGEKLIITIEEILHDSSHELGVDPGLIKDGVEAHLQELLAEHRDARRGLDAGPARVPDRDRPGRHPVPGRGRRDGRRRDQAARRDRRRRAADPLSGAAQPRSASGAGEGRVRGAGDQAAGAGAGDRPRDRLRAPSTTTCCGASRTPTCGCSEAARGTLWPGRAPTRQGARMTGPRHAEHDRTTCLGALREVVDDCVGTGSRIGYFAALYRQVTLAGSADGRFDDGERLSRFDAAFAGRYLAALSAWRGWPGPRPDGGRPVLVQHLSLGVGTRTSTWTCPSASARLCPGEAIAGARARLRPHQRHPHHGPGRPPGAAGRALAAAGGARRRPRPPGRGDRRLQRAEGAVGGVGRRRPPGAAAGDARDATEKHARPLRLRRRPVLAPRFPVPAALELLRSTERTGVAATIRLLDG